MGFTSGDPHPINQTLLTILVNNSSNKTRLSHNLISLVDNLNNNNKWLKGVSIWQKQSLKCKFHLLKQHLELTDHLINHNKTKVNHLNKTRISTNLRINFLSNNSRCPLKHSNNNSSTSSNTNSLLQSNKTNRIIKLLLVSLLINSLNPHHTPTNLNSPFPNVKIRYHESWSDTMRNYLPPPKPLSLEEDSLFKQSAFSQCLQAFHSYSTTCTWRGQANLTEEGLRLTWSSFKQVCVL